VPVEIGGVVFELGDLVIADTNGVVVIPKAIEQTVLKKASAYSKYGVL
jgi:4-hydroxy-4-methyl-2-oxoglutarate aldolase